MREPRLEALAVLCGGTDAAALRPADHQLARLVDEAIARIQAIDPGFLKIGLSAYRFELKNGRVEAARALLREAMARSPQEAADDALLFAWATGEPGVDAAAARELLLNYRFQFDGVFAAMRGDAAAAKALIAELLRPEEIGVTLNENYMLVPEQSTDAIVAHHPQAKYFNVGRIGRDQVEDYAKRKGISVEEADKAVPQ